MNTSMCKHLSFHDCELAILRMNIGKMDYGDGKQIVDMPETQAILRTVETFIVDRACIVYGGTAINNILPKRLQFYNYKYQIPDYDFYAVNPYDHAKQLVDILMKQGFTQVESKSAVHPGTCKVFVNQMPVADITDLHPELYHMLLKHSVRRKGIHYAPVNFLRQSMYSELSRPHGNRTRWEKVLTRLNLLNQEYPMKRTKCTLQRHMKRNKQESTIFKLLKQVFQTHDVMYIGGFANAIYALHTDIPKLENIPDFDVVSDNPHPTAIAACQCLLDHGFDATLESYAPIGELIPEHYGIKVGTEYVSFVYKSIGCHSYNVYRGMKIGTMDTLLSFYLAFMYADRPYFNTNRLTCLSTALFKVQQSNRLTQRGVTKRFGTTCYGTETTQNMLRERRNHVMQHQKSLPASEVAKYMFRYPMQKMKKQHNTTRKRLK